MCVRMYDTICPNHDHNEAVLQNMHIFRLHIRSRFLMYLFSGVLFLALPLSTHAFDVVVVKNADLKPYQEALRGLKKSCNCDVQEVRPGDEDVARSVLRRAPDAVVAIGTGSFRNVRSITGLPLVFAMVMPSETVSMSPNVSGVSMDIAPETFIATMKAIFPAAKRIGLVHDPKNTSAFAAKASNAARAMGVDLVIKQTSDPRMIPALLDELRGKVDIFWMLPDATVTANETVEYMLRFSFQNNIPVFSFSRKYVEMGAVAALDVNPYDMGVQAGEIVKRLKAGKIAPVLEWARSGRLSINDKVAAKMGLKIKAELMERAEEHE